MTQSAKIGGEFHTEAAVGRKWFGWVPLVGLLIFVFFCPVLLAVASFTCTDVMKRDTILSGVMDGLAQKKMGCYLGWEDRVIVYSYGRNGSLPRQHTAWSWLFV